jgi:hypothetical protein
MDPSQDCKSLLFDLTMDVLASSMGCSSISTTFMPFIFTSG